MSASPLHDAVRAGDLAVIDRLADAGANLGAKVDRTSPLTLALTLKKWDVARRLLDRGAPIDLAATGVAGRAGARFVDYVARLRRGDTTPALLALLIVDRDDQLAAQVIAAGAPVSGHGALVMAAERKCAPIVAMLLDAGARVDEGLPLHAAVHTGRTFEGAAECVRLLLDAGASIDACDAEGMTALMVACRDGFRDAARLLIERGADLSVVAPGQRMTALAFARSSLPDIASLLESLSSPDRAVRRPQPGRTLFIDECDICAALPDTGDGRIMDGLDVLDEREEHPESTTTITLTELRCPLCDSYYQRYRFYDDEDVPASPPTMEARLMRRCPATTVETLKALGRVDDLARFEASVPARVERFSRMLREPDTVPEALLPHMIKTVLDACGPSSFLDASPRVSDARMRVMTLRGYEAPHTR